MKTMIQNFSIYIIVPKLRVENPHKIILKYIACKLTLYGEMD